MKFPSHSKKPHHDTRWWLISFKALTTFCGSDFWGGFFLGGFLSVCHLEVVLGAKEIPRIFCSNKILRPGRPGCANVAAICNCQMSDHIDSKQYKTF